MTETIKHVQDTEHMISLRTYITDSSMVGESPGLLLAKCLAGEYKMIELLDATAQTAGLVIYCFDEKKRQVHLALLHAVNTSDAFGPLLLECFRRMGAAKIMAITKHNHDTFIKAVVKDLPVKTYTVLEVRLV